MRQSRLKLLGKLGPFVAASLIESMARCGNKGCHCHGNKGHTNYFLSLKRKGTTVTYYVPKSRLKEVRQWVMEHRRIKILSKEISDLSLELLRVEAQVRRQKRKKGCQD